MSVLDSFLLALIGALQRHEDIDQDDRTSVQGAKEPLDFFFFFFTPSMKELSMPPPLWAVITLNTILARRDILLAT